MRTRNLSANLVARLICRRPVSFPVLTFTEAAQRSAWQSQLFHSGLAVACVASLQFSGCVGGSRNELAKDLRDEAKKAAIHAQQEIDAKKRDSAVAQSTAGKTAPAGLATDPKVPAPKAAPAARRSNPLAEYLKRGRTEEVPEDPFVKQASASAPAKKAPSTSSATTVSQADAEWEALLEQKLALAKGRHPEQPGQNAVARVAEADRSLSPSRLQDSPAKARPFPTTLQSEKHPLRMAETPAATAPGASSAPVQQGPSEEGPLDEELLAAAPNWLQESSVRESASDGEASPSEQGAGGTAASQQLSNASTTESLPRVEPRSSQAAEAATDRAAVAESAGPSSQPDLSAKQARVRVDVLLELAHAQYKRGDLHAAYRNALHAHQVAEKENIAFAAGEELPGHFAESIAHELWGSPLTGNSKSASAGPSIRTEDTAATMPQSADETSRPALAPKGGEDQFVSAFGGLSAGAGWRTADAQLAGRHARSGIEQAPKPEGPESGKAGRGRQLQSNRPEWAASEGKAATTGVTSRDEHTTTAGWEMRNGTNAPRSVEWARVETVTPKDEWRSGPAFPSMAADPGQKVPSPPAASLADPFAATGAIDLQAPFPPESLPLVSTDVPASLRGGNPPESANANETPGSGRGLLWAIVGFVAAALSTMVGLRMQRSKAAVVEDPSEVSAATLPLTRPAGDDCGQTGTSRAA